MGQKNKNIKKPTQLRVVIRSPRTAAPNTHPRLHRTTQFHPRRNGSPAQPLRLVTPQPELSPRLRYMTDWPTCCRTNRRIKKKNKKKKTFLKNKKTKKEKKKNKIKDRMIALVFFYFILFRFVVLSLQYQDQLKPYTNSLVIPWHATAETLLIARTLSGDGARFRYWRRGWTQLLPFVWQLIAVLTDVVTVYVLFSTRL